MQATKLRSIQLSSAKFLKIALVLLLAMAISGFFYFENSIILRILIIIVGLIGCWQINKISEIVLLLVLYLGLYDLYNVHYWSGIPIAIIIIGVFFLSVFLFYVQAIFSKTKEMIDANVFRLYSMVFALSIVELFLTMDLWPTDPRTKSLILTVMFFVLSKVIYLYINSMLSFKKVVGYVIVSILILSIIIILSFTQGF